MTREELAKKIKAKNPAYSNLDDNELVDKIIAKYPVYKSQITETNVVKQPTVQEQQAYQKTIKPVVKSTGPIAVGPRISAIPKTSISVPTGKELAPTKEQQKELQKPLITGRQDVQQASTGEIIGGTAKSILSTAAMFFSPLIDVPQNISNLATGKQKTTPSEKISSSLEGSTAGEQEAKKTADVFQMLFAARPSKIAPSSLKIGTKIDDLSQLKINENQFLDGYNEYLKNSKNIDYDVNTGIFTEGSAEDRLARLYKQMKSNNVKPTVKPKIGNIPETPVAPPVTPEAPITTAAKQSWPDMTYESAVLRHEQEMSEKAVNSLSASLIGKVTKGKSTLQDAEVIASNVKTKENISKVLTDFSKEEVDAIVNSKNPTQDFANTFAKNKAEKEKFYRAVIAEGDKAGLSVDGNLVAKYKEAELLKDPKYKTLVNDILAGQKDGSIVFSKEKNKFVTDNFKYSDKVDEYNTIYRSLDETRNRNFTLDEAQTKVDSGNNTYKAMYKNQTKSGSLEHMSYKYEADGFRNMLKKTLDPATQGKFSTLAEERAAYYSVQDKIDKKLNQSVVEKMVVDGKTPFEVAKESVEGIDIEDILHFKPIKVAKKGLQNLFGQSYTSKMDDTVKNAFKKYYSAKTGQGAITLDDIYLKNLDQLKQKEYMSKFIEEFYKFKEQIYLPPAETMIQPQFTDSTIDSMLNLKFTPNDVLSEAANRQAFINELYRQPEMKLMIEQKATEASKMQGTVANPIIPKAPTTYEKPAAKIGNEDFKRIEKFIQDQEALKVFKGNQNKAYEIVKSKFDTIKENYPALVETIESHPLHDIINKQSKSGEFAGKLSDKASNLDNLLMERGYDDVEQGREAFEGLKELIYRRQRTEKEMSDLYGNLKEIKAGNKTIIDDYVNPKSTEIEDIDFGTIDTSVQPNIQPEKPKYKSMLEALNDQEFNRKQTEAINKTNRSNVTKRSNNLYHTTPISNLDSISKKGLTTGNKAKFEGISSSDNISFSANEVGAKYYAGDNEIIIRTKTGFKPKDLESDLLAGGEGAYITKTNIPPEMLEIKDGKKWVSLNEYIKKSKNIEPKVSLVEEAKKYDNVEDFIKAQGETHFHASKDNISDFSSKTTPTYFSKDKNFGNRYIGEKSINNNVILKLDKTANLDNKTIGKILDDGGYVGMGFGDTLKDVVESFNGSNTTLRDYVFRKLKKEGYDSAIIKNDWDGSFGKMKSTVVFDNSKIKTKSQLKDIYNQAKKTK